MKIKEDEKPERITVYLPSHIVAWIKQEAESERRSVSNFVTTVVEKAIQSK